MLEVSEAAGTYATPRGEARFEQEIKKSRFIGIATRVASEGEVSERLESVRKELPDATHHCWAYVIGDPTGSARIRASDDGEPSGTAGRPILGVIQHKNIGNILVIVVRYYGGTKLGSGGLTRAYASTTSGVVEACELERHTPRSTARLELDYPDEPVLRRLIGDLAIELLDTRYTARVELIVRFESARRREIVDAIRDLTHARAQLVAL